MGADKIRKPDTRVELEADEDTEALDGGEEIEPAEVGLNLNSGQNAGIDERLPGIDRHRPR